MKTDKTSYYEPSAEHMFEETDEEKIEEAFREIIQNNPQDAPHILARRFLENWKKYCEKIREQRETEKEEVREEARVQLAEGQESAQEEIQKAEDSAREYKKRAKVWEDKARVLERRCGRRRVFDRIGCWLLLVIMFMLFLEYVFPKWLLVTLATVLFEKVLEAVCDLLRNGEKRRSIKNGIERKTNGLRETVGNFFHKALSKSGLCKTAYFVTVCLAAGALAGVDAGESMGRFLWGGYAAVTNSPDMVGTVVKLGVYGGICRGESMLPPEQPGVTVTVEAKRYLTGADEQMIRWLDNSIVSQEDINMILNLSQEDYNILFFLEGLAPGTVESQEQLNERILREVKIYTEEKKENQFDKAPDEGGPEQKILNQISGISELEKEAISFSEIKEILIFRESVNREYPKRTLTQMVSNGYHKLALLLYWHGGVESTLVYYYGQSILFGLECLKYADNTDLTVKEKLNFIAHRYEDIVYTCPGFRDAERAKMLAKAFRYAADQY